MRSAMTSSASRSAFPLSIADRFSASLSVTHDAGEFQRFSDPAAIVLAIEIDRQVQNMMGEIRKSGLDAD
jgi:hypothetical protein